MKRIRVGVAAAATLLGAVTDAVAQNSPDWTEPFPPFRIAGNLYYVGSKGLANYLIATPQGLILINSDLEANVPLIKASIEQLGFKFSDVKILLISHAHWDHDAGSAKIKALTGARYMVMDADVPDEESTARGRPGAHVDRVLHDRDTVELGGSKLTARLTPGHTKGCTTWRMRTRVAGAERDVVMLCSLAAPGYRLVNNTAYPDIVADYRRSFERLAAIPCDVPLTSHGSHRPPSEPAAFVDPERCRAIIASSREALEAELARQSAAPAR